MIIIRCAKCRAKIFKYKKIGKGRLLHCWKDRIVKDYTVRAGDEVRCACGNLIGVSESKWIRMKQNAFSHSGTISRR
jgi:hypothetical protein